VISAPPAAAVIRVENSAKRLALYLVGGALLSKILGLVREVLVARAIGASMVADAFRGGQTACLLPLLFLQSESVPAILIPLYREWREDGSAPRRFAALTVSLTLLAVLLFIIVESFAPFWIDVLLAGFSQQAHELTLVFTRVMALAMPASVLMSCLAGSEIARGQSRTTSIRATLTNVAVIMGVGVFLLTNDPVVLAWSFTVAFNLTALWALWRSIREGALDFSQLRPTEVWAAFMIYMRRLRPLLMQPIGEHALIWIERLLASGLAVGTLASLDYARTLTDCAVLLVSQPIGLAVLSRGPSSDLRGQMDALARPVLALAIPASMFLFFFAPEIVELVFHRGAFDAAAIESTSEILRGIAAGLWATTLGWILIRMLNSVGRNRRATIIVATGYFANILTGALLVQYLGGAALGVGEAVRGIIMLTGVGIALGCGRHLLRLLGIMAPVVFLLAIGEWIVRAEVQGLFPRLIVGGCVMTVAMLISIYLLVPRARAIVFSRFTLISHRRV